MGLIPAWLRGGNDHQLAEPTPPQETRVKTSRPDQPATPDWEPTPPGEVRDPEAMEDEPSFTWGPDDDR